MKENAIFDIVEFESFTMMQLLEMPVSNNQTVSLKYKCRGKRQSSVLPMPPQEFSQPHLEGV